MALPANARLGPYQLLALLGAGGMGEVYKARDTRLDRTVAIKILPEQFAADPDRRTRFEREARAAAALNHPHICDLHDVGEASDPTSPTSSAAVIRFLVMEYLDGQTLAERLLRGPLSPSEVLRCAIELADALDHAHRHGLVHRDLKPGNVMLTRSGAKLLDFGLSKLRTTPDLLVLSTVSPGGTPLTAEGTVLGTFPYMAPEQLAGREADARSDIFAFGALLHEMSTGRRAFEGSTAATVIGAVLHTDPPPVSSLQPLAPPALDRIVVRCLAKDPDDRWQTARDLLLELKWIADHPATPVAEQPRDTKRNVGLIVAAASAVLVIATAAFFVGFMRGAPADDSTIRLPFSPPEGIILSDLGVAGPITISPDGQRVVFVGTGSDGSRSLWVRGLDSLAALALAGTDGAAFPFWSPDSRFIGFFAQGKLKRIASSGGPPQVICDTTQPTGGTWNAEDVILFSSGAGHQLSRVDAGGGTPTALAADSINEERHRPHFLPDGRHFMYYGRPGPQWGIYLASIDSPGTARFLRQGVGVAYASGYLLVLLGSTRGAITGTLWAQPFDLTRLELTGKESPVAEQVTYRSGGASGAFSVSQTGHLIYGNVKDPVTRLTWFDRTGTRLGTMGGSVAYSRPSLSPDEKTVAVERIDPEPQQQDLWLIEASRGIASRFTSDPSFDSMPIWSPDGTRIVFASPRESPPNLYQKALLGGDEEPLVKSKFNDQPADWSRDGRLILYQSLHPHTQWDLWLVPMSGAETERTPFPYLQTVFNERLGRFSPDGLWVAYTSDQSGRDEVYVRMLRKSDSARQISADGGTAPNWSRNGRELFYLRPDGTLMVVGVKPGAAFETGAPVRLFQTRISSADLYFYGANYTVTGDGKRFLVNTVTEESNSIPTTIVLNWPAVLGRP